MQVNRAYGSNAMRRRPKDVVRPKEVLAWWKEARGYLQPASREQFLRHPATPPADELDEDPVQGLWRLETEARRPARWLRSEGCSPDPAVSAPS